MVKEKRFRKKFPQGHKIFTTTTNDNSDEPAFALNKLNIKNTSKKNDLDNDDGDVNSGSGGGGDGNRKASIPETNSSHSNSSADSTSLNGPETSSIVKKSPISTLMSTTMQLSKTSTSPVNAKGVRKFSSFLSDVSSRLFPSSTHANNNDNDSSSAYAITNDEDNESDNDNDGLRNDENYKMEEEIKEREIRKSLADAGGVDDIDMLMIGGGEDGDFGKDDVHDDEDDDDDDGDGNLDNIIEEKEDEEHEPQQQQQQQPPQQEEEDKEDDALSNSDSDGQNDDDSENFKKRKKRHPKKTSLLPPPIIKIKSTKEMRQTMRAERQQIMKDKRRSTMHQGVIFVEPVIEEEVVLSMAEILLKRKMDDQKRLEALDVARDEDVAFLKALKNDDDDNEGDDDDDDDNLDRYHNEEDNYTAETTLSDVVIDTINGSSLFKFERYFIYFQFTSLILSTNVTWPVGFTHTFGIIAWLTHEFHLYIFHATFANLTYPTITDVVDLPLNYWILNYLIKLIYVLVFIALFFNFWVISDYTNPKYTDRWVRVYIDNWYNITRVRTCGFLHAVIYVCILEGILIALGVTLTRYVGASKGAAVITAGSLVVTVFFAIYVVAIQCIRTYFFSRTRNNTYYTRRILMKSIVEVKNQVCLFLLTALYLPTCVTIIKSSIQLHDWNDTHAHVSRIASLAKVNYENLFYANANANHGYNALTRQVNYNTPCYYLSFPPNVNPTTLLTTPIVTCHSMTGYILHTSSLLLFAVYCIGFPLLCLYLSLESYEAFTKSNWYPNYSAAYTTYVNARRQLERETTMYFRGKVRTVLGVRDFAQGCRQDFQGAVDVFYGETGQKKSRLELRNIRVKRRKREKRDVALLEGIRGWRKAVKRLALCRPFTVFVYIVILVNVAVMMHERDIIDISYFNRTSTSLSTVSDSDSDSDETVNDTSKLQTFNVIFALIFLFEFVVKSVGMTWRFFWRDYFNRLDFALVLFSGLEFVLIPLLSSSDADEENENDNDNNNNGGSGLNSARVLRLLKILRLLKVLRIGKILTTLKYKASRHLKLVELMYKADDYNWPEWRRALKIRLLKGSTVGGIYFVIFLNLTGVAFDGVIRSTFSSGDSIMLISDLTFAVIFTIEMTFKLVGFGYKLYFLDPFEDLNFTLVLMGWIEIIFLSASGGGAVGAVKAARFLRFARFARFARILKVFKPQSNASWRYQKGLEYKVERLTTKYSMAHSEYISSLDSFGVDHELIITNFDVLLDASSASYLIRPFKHEYRYWKAFHFLEVFSFTCTSVITSVSYTPSQQLTCLTLLLVGVQVVHVVCMPFLTSRERKLDFFCRFTCILNCIIGIMIAEQSIDVTFAGLLLLIINLALLTLYCVLVNVPRLLITLKDAIRNHVDSGIVHFLFTQITRKSYLLENVHTGLQTLQQWDNMILDERTFGTSRCRPSNLLTRTERVRYMKWAALRNLKLIKVKDASGTTMLHEAMAQAEVEVCRWLVRHDGGFVGGEDEGRDTPVLIGVKELARALLAIEGGNTAAAGDDNGDRSGIGRGGMDEDNWKRARYADVFLSPELHNCNPQWNRFHYATLPEIAVPRLGEYTMQLCDCFNLHPPDGYVRISAWAEYEVDTMKYMAEMYVASRTELDLCNKELGDIGYQALLEITVKVSQPYTTYTVPSNFKLYYTINICKVDLRHNRLKHAAGLHIAEMLDINKTITYLDLSVNSIDDDAGISIMKALRHNHTLVTFKFARNLLGPGAGTELSKGLRKNTVLKEIDLSSNSMGPKKRWKDAETCVETDGAGFELGMSLRHNKALTKLNLAWNKLGYGTGDAFAQMLRRNSCILHLDLGGNEILVDGGRYIANSITKNKTVTFLNVEENQLGPKAGMAFARSLKENYVLAHLDLSTNRLGYKAGQAFAIALMHNTSLISINLTNNDFGPNVGKKWAGTIARNVSLTDVNLSQNDMGTASNLGGDTSDLGMLLKNAFKQNSTITSLNFSDCNIIKDTLVSICGGLMQVKNIRKLKLDSMVLDEPSMLQLCRAIEGYKITELSLSRCDIGESAKSATLFTDSLFHCTKLTKLDVGGNRLGPRCCESLALFLNLGSQGMRLKHLNIGGNNFGAAGGMGLATSLSMCNTMEYLDVSDNGFDDEVCAELADSLREIIQFGVVKRPSHMIHFDARGNSFGDEASCGLISAFCNDNTKYLCLKNCGLGPLSGIAIARGLKKPTISWEVLDLSVNNLGKDGANSVWWAMRKNHSVIDLDICDNNIGRFFGTGDDTLGEHGISIETALCRNYTLRHLKMKGNDICSIAGVGFAESLAVNQSLQTVDFEGNEFDYVVGECLGERLKFDGQILAINLRANNMGWRGGGAIAMALYTNRYLLEVNLSDNNLGESGPKIGIQFAKALYQNSVLTHLDLSSNRFGPKVGFAFADALVRNMSLLRLNLENNRFDDEVGGQMLEMVGKNVSLTHLELTEVEVSASFYFDIKKIIDSRQ